MTRRAPLLLVLLLVVPLLVLLTGPPAHACSCADAGPRRMIATSAAAFAGVVDGVRGGGDGLQVSELRVDRVWKGELTERTEVVHGTESSACGLDPRIGQRMVVYASREVGDLTTSLCEVRLGQGEIDRAVQVLGEGTAPAAGSTEVSVGEGPPVKPLVVGGLLLAAGAWIVVRRRLRTRPR